MVVNLLLAIALEFSLPSYFVVAIARVENPTYDAAITHRNTDGTYDLGIMQLNTSWYKDPNWDDPETNIRAGCKHIKMLRSQGLTWYEVAIAYNCGLQKLRSGKPPNSSIDYAARVFEVWATLDKDFSKYIGN
jgi:soluble lytic murein transglycosylase-like protein